jgi:hypothetical protein
MRRKHDFEYARYVIAWDNGEQSEIWPTRLQTWKNVYSARWKRTAAQVETSLSAQ